MNQALHIFWFRRDLRLHDNVGLLQALQSEHAILPIFIFDRNILDKLEDKQDRRVEFIHGVISGLKAQLRARDSDLWVFYGKPQEIFQELISNHPIKAVFTNHDYEPYARERDQTLRDLLNEQGIAFHTFKDQCIFEEKEVLSKSDSVYTVFTPYSKAWRTKFGPAQEPVKISDTLWQNTLKPESSQGLISLEEMGFQATGEDFPQHTVQEDLLTNYDKQRDFPAIRGTSRLSVHLRFGTVSIREMVQKAREHSFTWETELIWRDFYMMILANFPHVAHRSFRKEYDHIPWRNHEEEFQAWCEGRTGYPIVDAGMRELNHTGFMHNRVRMITASFLTKHLLIDWRWGEAYFAKKLLDFELSSNNGGWQWAAGSGTDAAPYFRIFNPTTQIKKFDKDLQYIKQWIPELNQLDYPQPLVDHKFARERCLKTYKTALEEAKSLKA